MIKSWDLTVTIEEAVESLRPNLIYIFRKITLAYGWKKWIVCGQE